MALFKISKGMSENLPADKVAGHCWYTIDESLFYIDFEDENGALQRKALNAVESAQADAFVNQKTGSQLRLWYGSKAEYDALGTLDANTIYITGNSLWSVSDASDVEFDNANSGLTATNVQTAINEIASKIPTIQIMRWEAGE